MIIVLGLVVGLVSTFLGIGGGLLIVPILPLITNISIRESVATAQATVLFVVAVNSINFARRFSLPKKIVLTIGFGAGLGALISANLNMAMPEPLVVAILDLILWVLAGILFYKSSRPSSQLFNLFVVNTQRLIGERVFLFLLGLAAGSCGGFTGIGSGIIATAFLAASAFIFSEIEAVYFGHCSMCCSDSNWAEEFIFILGANGVRRRNNPPPSIIVRSRLVGYKA